MKNKKILFALIPVLLIVLSNMTYSVPVVGNKAEVVAKVLRVETGEEDGYKVSKFKLEITDSEDVSGYTNFAKVGEVVEAVAYHKDSSTAKVFLEIKEGDLIKGYLARAGDEWGGEWQISDVVIVKQIIGTCKSEGEFCGGIAGIKCCSGLYCQLDGTYPDAGGICVALEKKCVKEGEYTTGPVSPEYATHCCDGLEGFDALAGTNKAGVGVLCYDPKKGEPVCKATGSEGAVSMSNGWYYPSGQLLRWENCGASSQVKKYRYAYWVCYDGRESKQGGESYCKTESTWRAEAEKFCNQNCGKVIACTEEAKLCPDGSTVSRTSPDCEFAPCPSSTSVTGASTIVVEKPKVFLLCGVKDFNVWDECSESEHRDVPVIINKKFELKQGQRAIVKDYSAMKITYLSEYALKCVCAPCIVSEPCPPCECPERGVTLYIELPSWDNQGSRIEGESGRGYVSPTQTTTSIVSASEVNGASVTAVSPSVTSSSEVPTEAVIPKRVKININVGSAQEVFGAKISLLDLKSGVASLLVTAEQQKPVCGNGVCEAGEGDDCEKYSDMKVDETGARKAITCKIGSCPEDCVKGQPVCGNGICEYGEAEDCPKCESTFCMGLCPKGTCPQDCVDQPVVIPATECDNGCDAENICYPVSTRAVIKGIPSYCDVTKTFKEQQEEEDSCQNDYECVTNECSSGECIDLKKELEETQSLLQKILDWLKGIF